MSESENKPLIQMAKGKNADDLVDNLRNQLSGEEKETALDSIRGIYEGMEINEYVILTVDTDTGEVVEVKQKPPINTKEMKEL